MTVDDLRGVLDELHNQRKGGLPVAVEVEFCGTLVLRAANAADVQPTPHGRADGDLVLLIE